MRNTNRGILGTALLSSSLRCGNEVTNRIEKCAVELKRKRRESILLSLFLSLDLWILPLGSIRPTRLEFSVPLPSSVDRIDLVFAPLCRSPNQEPSVLPGDQRVWEEGSVCSLFRRFGGEPGGWRMP